MAEPAESRLTARKLLHHLDAEVAMGPRLGIVNSFAEAVEPLFSLVIEAGGRNRGEGERAFAMFHLAARSITDLIAAVHLASHAYIQQAYTLIRPTHESCDLMELFAQHPDEAAKWVHSEMPGAEYRPARVRRRIGEPSVGAEIYGHLSEMGPHPRFTGSRVSGLMKINVEHATNRRAVLRIGSFFEEHPAALHVYAFAFEALVRVGFKVRHLEEVSEQMNRARWLTAYEASVRATSVGCKLVRQELVEMQAADGSEFLETIYDDLLAALQPGGRLDFGNEVDSPE